MALRTWVARFVVDNGRVTEEGGRWYIPAPAADDRTLTRTSCERVAPAELGAQALDAGAFFPRLSLTGGLVRALLSTHQTLLDWNRRSLPREQVSCGVSAAAVSGPVVYLAQAGPGLAFLRQAGILQRLRPAEEAVAPLGEGEVEPSVRRIELAPGDLLLAASPALERISGPETLAAAGASSEEALPSCTADEGLAELRALRRDVQ
jgi:hypothetical protein